MRYEAIKHVFESMCKPADSKEARHAGAEQFVKRFRAELGLSHNEYGRPTIVAENRKYSPNEFSLRGLAEALCGYEWCERLGRSTAQDYMVFEAGGNPAVVPGNLPNVSAYLASVTGLLDAAVIAGYEKPEYIIDRLVQTEPTKVRQRKFIGTGRVGDAAGRRNPGDGHVFAQFSERYSVSPETFNDALACAVSFESVFFDQTGEVLERANSIGEELGLRKELDGFRMIAGVTNPYNYGGTSYNTYLTSGNWINDGANELVDWTNVDVANALFSRMTDQETGNRITVTPDTMLVSPAREWRAKHIMRQTQIETVTQGVSNQADSERRFGPYAGWRFEPVSSPYLDQILTSAAAVGGLALTQTQADGYWWLLRTGPKGAFYRTENWGITINRASPSDFTMLNQKLLLAVFADYMHAFGVRDPRFVVRNTKS